MNKVNTDLIDAAELTQTLYSDTQTGRAAFDARGNSVWEWSLDSGEFSTDITSTQMNRLVDPAAFMLADETVKLRTISERWIYQSDRR